MAQFIDFQFLTHNQTRNIADSCGFCIVPIAGETTKGTVETNWIEKNIKGKWTSFAFGVPYYGHAYCFADHDEAMAFKLWRF